MDYKIKESKLMSVIEKIIDDYYGDLSFFKEDDGYIYFSPEKNKDFFMYPFEYNIYADKLYIDPIVVKHVMKLIPLSENEIGKYLLDIINKKFNFDFKSFLVFYL